MEEYIFHIPGENIYPYSRVGMWKIRNSRTQSDVKKLSDVTRLEYYYDWNANLKQTTTWEGVCILLGSVCQLVVVRRDLNLVLNLRRRCVAGRKIIYKYNGSN